MIAHHTLGPGMKVIGALALASLCADCIAERSGLTPLAVLDELVQMNAARQRRGRPGLGPVNARCQRCEAPKPVYRLR